MPIVDATLVAHLQSNEPLRVKAAWTAWYERDAEAVRRTLHQVAAPETDIAAVAHDAFIVAVKRIQSTGFHYRRGKLRRYVCAVALNLLRSEQREWRWREIPFAALGPEYESQIIGRPAEAVEGPEASVEARHFEQWLAGQVRAGLATLDPDERALLLAHHLDGRTQRELAAERSIPTATLGVRLWRLRARLRRQPALRAAWEALAA